MRQIALWRCLRCGECCRHIVGQRFGLALLPQEAERLRALASRRSLTLDLKPLTWNGYRVTLYQFAQKACPFLTRNNRCSIYRLRPLACRIYPLHPYGISDCTYIDRMQRRGFQIAFPLQLRSTANLYLREVTPLIKGAVLRYNLNRGWEPNTRFAFNSTYGSV